MGELSGRRMESPWLFTGCKQGFSGKERGRHMHLHIGHMIVSSIVHGVIYAAIFKIFKGLGIVGALVLATAVIAIIWFSVKLFQNRQ